MVIEIGINKRLLSPQGWRDKESSSALGNSEETSSFSPLPFFCPLVSLWLHPAKSQLTRESEKATWRVSSLKYRLDQGKEEWISRKTGPKFSNLFIHTNHWVINRTASQPPYITMYNMKHKLRVPGTHCSPHWGEGQREGDRLSATSVPLIFIILRLVLSVPREELFSRTWKQNPSQWDSREKRRREPLPSLFPPYPPSLLSLLVLFFF